MLMLIEKVMPLKATDFFAESPDEVLADLAALLVEVTAEAGEIILEQGTTINSMYIIVDGRVRLHDGPQTVAELSQNDHFGALALLNPSPHPLAVSAVTEVRLLRLDQTSFFDFLEDHSQVSRQIIRRLAQRLQRAVDESKVVRARNDLLEELQGRLNQQI